MRTHAKRPFPPDATLADRERSLPLTACGRSTYDRHMAYDDMAPTCLSCQRALKKHHQRLQRRPSPNPRKERLHE